MTQMAANMDPSVMVAPANRQLCPNPQHRKNPREEAFGCLKYTAQCRVQPNSRAEEGMMKNMGGNAPAMDSSQMQEQMMPCSKT